jgi:ribosome biogenesis GTPase
MPKEKNKNSNLEGLVIKVTGKEYLVKTQDAKKYMCVIKGSLRVKDFKATNPVAIGDIVSFEWNEEKKLGFIKDIKERRNYIIRKSAKLSKQFQIIAANIDQAFLVATLINPPTSTEFIDRFLATAEAYNIPATIIFNKIDLYTTKELQEDLFFLENVYKEIGYNVLKISVKENINLDQVQEATKNKINLFTGHSGVGKSSLIKALIPDIEIKIGNLSHYHLKGKNTTSHSEMFELPYGGYLIDTPGIKGFGLYEFKKEELSHFFPEIFKIGRNCEFNNCTHTHEPGCAVKKAVEEGIIAYTRYESYLDIFFDENEKYRKPF